MNEVVKIHNDLTNERIGKMTAKQLDLFLTICYKLKDKGTDNIVIDFAELRTLTKFKKSNSNAEINKELDSIIEAMFFVVKRQEGSKRTYEVMFDKFETDTDTNTITVQVKPQYAYIFNDLVKNFTRFELEEFISLQSKYSKRLYKLLKQYRSTGKYITSKEQLYADLDIPSNYNNSNFCLRAFNPALEECKNYFNGLAVEVQKGGRGGAVKGYVFTFVKEKNTRNKTIKATKNSNKFNDFQQNDYNFDELENKLLSN